MNKGEFKGAFSSQKCSVEYSYRALKNLPFGFMTSLDVLAHESGLLQVKIYHRSPDYLNNVIKQYETIDRDNPMNIMHTKATTKNGLDLVIASSLITSHKIQKIIHEDWDSGMHFLKAIIRAEKGQNYHFDIVSSLISS